MHAATFIREKYPLTTIAVLQTSIRIKPDKEMRPFRTTLNAIVVFSCLMAVSSCNGQEQKGKEQTTDPDRVIALGDTVSALGKDMGCIYQDRENNYWFASNGDGVYRYDGKSLLRITDKHGLCSNFVLSIQEDINGNLWFSTRDGICQFNGKAFTEYTNSIRNARLAKLQYRNGGLFFSHSDILSFYDGQSFTRFTIHPGTYPPLQENLNGPYRVYSTLIDKAGNVWFGTQERGVCRYDGESFTFYTEEGLGKAAVRTLYQDKAGTIWAGNNGAGLFRFTGNGFKNFTEEKGVANPGFLNNLQAKEGTLARPWTINEDDEGNLWIGTIDAGVWKYDGTRLTNYTTSDGLSGNSISVIYKDRKGELWFMTDGDEVCKFNGRAFTKVELK
jgi:ligand-binding sensor domain-containing protein